MEQVIGLLKNSLWQCLNPYYNGRYSWRQAQATSQDVTPVLILIIMEDTHGEDDT